MATSPDLTINLSSISFLKNGIAINILPLPTPLIIQQNGSHSIHDQVAVISDVTLNKGNIGTIGYVYVRNLDATNNLSIGPDGVTYNIILKPGQHALFRWNAAAIHAKSTAGSPIIEYMLIED